MVNVSPWMTDAVVVALITGLAGYLTAALSAQRELRAPYQQLAKRVSQLEREIKQLMTRDRLWQSGWSNLCAKWDERRQDPNPPEHPLSKLEEDNEFI